MKNREAFLALVRGGLWEREVWLSQYGTVDFDEVMRIAEEQSIIGLVTAGLEHMSDVKVPQEDLLQFVGQTLQIEQQNKDMNVFVARLIERLRREEVYAVLVKGQGIAQCYEKPLWRCSGDVDLLLSSDNYVKSKSVLDKIADNTERETAKNIKRKHQEYQFEGWTVELHGTMHAGLSRRVDRVIDEAQRDVFYGGNVRSWNNDNTTIFLPSPDNDVIFVFTHILQHLFLEGIGLRQICDWCRLLYTYKESLNHGLLESRIKKMGLMTEWKTLSSLAADYLGMPIEAMPFYDARYRNKGSRLMDFVMEVGNFGHNREVDWSNGFKRRSMLIWHRITDTIKLARVFPVDAPKFLLNYAIDGVRGLVRS